MGRAQTTGGVGGFVGDRSRGYHAAEYHTARSLHASAHGIVQHMDIIGQMHTMQANAARSIQAVFRGHKGREEAHKVKEEKDVAAELLTNEIWLFKERQKQARFAAAVRVQAVWSRVASKAARAVRLGVRMRMSTRDLMPSGKSLAPAKLAAASPPPVPAAAKSAAASASASAIFGRIAVGGANPPSGGKAPPPKPASMTRASAPADTPYSRPNPALPSSTVGGAKSPRGMLLVPVVSPIPEGTPRRSRGGDGGAGGIEGRPPSPSTGWSSGEETPHLLDPHKPRTDGRIDLLLKDQAQVAARNVHRIENTNDDIDNLVKKREEADAALAELQMRERQAELDLRRRIDTQMADLQAGLDALQEEMNAAGHDLKTLQLMLGTQTVKTDNCRTGWQDKCTEASIAQETADDLSAEWQAAQDYADSEQEAARQAQARADMMHERSKLCAERFYAAQDETTRQQERADNTERIEALARTIHNLQASSARGDGYAMTQVQQCAADLKSELDKRERIKEEFEARAMEDAAAASGAD